MKPDVQSEADIRRVVDAFYRGIDDDPVIGRYFADVDLDAHLPTLYAFWSSVVFHTGTYRGRPFDPHAALQGLETRHFERWLHRFEEAIDARYAGEAAERVKAKARQIAAIFQVKLGAYPPEQEQAPP